MTFPTTMTGHDRTYLAPRALRSAVGEVTAWELFALESNPKASTWATATLASLVASIDQEGVDKLGCTDCADTGFYGVAEPDDPDMLSGLIRRVGNDVHQSLQTSGVWSDWDPKSVPLEVLDLELAGELAAAITAGASGLLRRYGNPRAWLPPTDVVASAPLSYFISADSEVTPQGEWVNLAVVDEVDQGAVFDLVRVRPGEAEVWDMGDWTPDEDLLVKADLPMVRLDEVQLAEVQSQLDSVTASGLTAASFDPRAEKLRRYWSSGRGSAKIRWRTPGDWRRCYKHLRKYLGLRAKGYCQLLHRRNNGFFTGSKLNASGAGNPPSSHVFRVGDCFEVAGPEAVPYAAEVVNLHSLGNRADPQLVSDAVDQLITAFDTDDAVAVVLQRREPHPVAAASEGSHVEQSSPGPSAVSVPTSTFGQGDLISPTLMDVRRAQTAGQLPLLAAVEAALHRQFDRQGRVGSDVAVLLPSAVVATAVAASDNRKPLALVDCTAGHRFHNTPPLLGQSPEEMLLASLRSGRSTGDTEGNTNMPDLQLLDGEYRAADYENEDLVSAITAGAIPVAPPDEWFEDPKLDRPTTITIEASGRVFGHLAPWDITHIGMAGDVPPPPNPDGQYRYFRTGQLVTASGASVRVGQLTLAGGHAPTQGRRLSTAEVVSHYDDTNTGMADVAVGEDPHGIWVAGALRPAVTPEQIRVMRATPPSGDWRAINGNLELVAACHVNVQGFPIAASAAAGGATFALVAAGARTMAELMAAERADKVVLAQVAELRATVEALAASAAVAEAPAVEPEATDNPAAAATTEVEAPAASSPETTNEVAEEEAPQLTEEELARADKISKARELSSDIKRQLLRDRKNAATASGFVPFKKKDDKDEGSTVKGTDSFPIKDVASLKKAIQANGRAKDKEAARKHIKSMAYKLHRADLIPSSWK